MGVSLDSLPPVILRTLIQLSCLTIHSRILKASLKAYLSVLTEQGV